uniref:G_PROTEIN_RECEP_F1_2 domain-containing protein n=1 Tax=Angiostrongylus cantonensis TaxID=6313 RepID=A0A0K0DML1_ANGCA
LLSSSLNPLIYIAYSHKYRRAFHKILLLPCQYERVRGTILRSTETQLSEGNQTQKVCNSTLIKLGKKQQNAITDCTFP